MKKMLLAMLLLIACSTFTMAQNVKINFQEYDLPNGLHVILYEDHTTPNVITSILYHVGSKNENPERTGFAHFFEHLMFEGTPHIKRQEYFKLIQSNGGEVNAFTSFDKTYYYEIVPSNYLEMALWMESERMQKLNIDNEGLETQRSVVKEEKKMRYDNTPYGKLMNVIFEKSFQQHPYHWTPIGQSQYIDKAKLEEFIEFYKTYYVPNNATLTIAGDINVAQTKAWISKYFGALSKGTLPINRPNVVEPPVTHQVVDTFYDNVPMPVVITVYHTPPQTDKDFYALSLLNSILSDGKTSRMYKTLVEDKKIALQAEANSIPFEDPGISFYYSIVKPGVDCKDVLKEMNALVADLRNNVISDAELEKLKNSAEKTFLAKVSAITSVASALANYRVFFGNTNLINTDLKNYLSVTKEDIKRVANKYLNDNQQLVIYYLPQKK